MATRHLLDPGKIVSGEGEWIPDGPVKTEVRKFGFFPDVKQLRPGDLMLSQDRSPDLISRYIVRSQKEAGFGESDRNWTHAAMYIGDREHLVEANFDLNPFKPRGVQIVGLDEYVGSHIIRFRRPKSITDDGLPPLERTRIKQLGWM